MAEDFDSPQSPYHPSRDRLREIAHSSIPDEYEGKHVKDCILCLRFINEVLKDKKNDRDGPK